MVDYSKWDKFHDSSSDEDEDDMRPEPHVTRLDSGTRVSFSPNGVSFQPSASSSSSGTSSSVTPASSSSTAEDVVLKRKLELTRNGGEESTHLWSQTREDVHVSIFVPKDTRGRDIKVVLVPHGELSSGRKPHMTVSVRGSVVVDDDVAFPFSDDEDDLDDCYELQDFDETRRVCIVELKKVHVMGAMDSAVLWWDRALASDKKCDVKDFVDADHSAAGEERKRKWAEAWEEAHKLFREKVQAHKPIVIDTQPRMEGADADEEDDD